MGKNAGWICASCGHLDMKKRGGTQWGLIFLFLVNGVVGFVSMFLFPVIAFFCVGFVFLLVLASVMQGTKSNCRGCGEKGNIIPADSPRGELLVRQIYEARQAAKMAAKVE